MIREEALKIVHEYVKNDNLIRHMLAVEAAMRYYAKKHNQDVETWGITGLLHDFDWEIHPTLEEHPHQGVPILKEKGVPELICRAILSHADHTGVPRQTLMEKALFACDEITGLIIAVALVRPSRSLSDLKVKSVRKKWKDKAFAAGANRDEIAQGAKEFGVDLWVHTENIIEAMKPFSSELGLYSSRLLSASSVYFYRIQKTNGGNPVQSKKIYLVIITLVLASLACGLNVNLPITTDLKTGPTRIEEINIPPLDSTGEIAHLSLSFGAGELNLSAGASDSLLAGDATYNVDDLNPKIDINGNSIKVETGNLNIDGIPNFDERVKNIWDLNLGTDPIDLTIKAGAYVGDFELGGLSITDLHISDGASDVSVNFGQPNLVEMETLRYETGASNINLNNLLNANFDTMIFQSGAGNYQLDFSGYIQRDTTVFIETGLSSITLLVPETTNAQLTVEGGLATITTRGGWEQSGNLYMTNGEGPTLTITVEMNAGNIILDTP